MLIVICACWHEPHPCSLECHAAPRLLVVMHWVFQHSPHTVHGSEICSRYLSSHALTVPQPHRYTVHSCDEELDRGKGMMQVKGLQTDLVPQRSAISRARTLRRSNSSSKMSSPSHSRLARVLHRSQHSTPGAMQRHQMLSPADSEEIQETLMTAPSESNVAPGEGDSPRWPSLPVWPYVCSHVCLCMRVHGSVCLPACAILLPAPWADSLSCLPDILSTHLLTYL